MPAGALLHLSLQSAKHEPDRFAARLGDALQATGFAVITDHGLPQELIDECLRHFRQRWRAWLHAIWSGNSEGRHATRSQRILAHGSRTRRQPPLSVNDAT